MARLLQWGTSGSKKYQTGLDRGVLYIRNTSGVYDIGEAWNGLVSVNENPSGGEISKKYADNEIYLQQISREEYKATIEAFSYPEKFAVCDGSLLVAPGVYMAQQDRAVFGLSYRTLIGNDVSGEGLGYTLHLVYGALAKPSQRGYTTINESPDAIQFSWEIETTPVNNSLGKATAHITIDSTVVDQTKLAALEAILYGDDVAPTPARLPLPDEVATILS